MTLDKIIIIIGIIITIIALITYIHMVHNPIQKCIRFTY